jgi:hypothetical protein
MTAAVVPTHAFGQTATEDAAGTAMARARFKEGVAYYDKGQYELARASFLQAYALKKHPAILLNLGWSCLKAGHALESARYFKQFLSDGKDTMTDKQRSDANDGLTQASDKLGEIDVSAPAGADVTVDSDHIGAAPLAEPVLVDVGTHAVHVREADGTTDTQSVTVLTGEKASVHFAPAAPPPPPPPPEPPPAPAETAPAPPPAPPPPTPEPVATAPVETETAPPPKEPPPEHPSTLPLWPSNVGIGLSLAGFAGGIVALSAVNTAQTNADNTAAQILGSGGRCPPVAPRNTQSYVDACNTYKNDNNLVQEDRTTGWVLIGVGSGLLVGSIAYFIVAVAHNSDSDSPKSARPTITPVVGPSFSGMAVSGAF